MATTSSTVAVPGVGVRTIRRTRTASKRAHRSATLGVAGRAVEVREPIALGHKVALGDIQPGEPVRKYGQIIGFAAKAIPAGSWVHVHNLKADLFERDYAYASEAAPKQPRFEGRTF